MPCFVTHLEAAIDGTHLPAGELQTLHKDRPLWVRYDLDAVRQSLSNSRYWNIYQEHILVSQNLKLGYRSHVRLLISNQPVS